MYDNRIFQISAITDEFPLLNTPEFGIGVVDWNNIHPIPITEEALVKMGAVKLEDKRYNLKAMIINIMHGKFIEYVHQIELKGIHHLQNLYYYTRQTELSYESTH